MFFWLVILHIPSALSTGVTMATLIFVLYLLLQLAWLQLTSSKILWFLVSSVHLHGAFFKWSTLYSRLVERPSRRGRFLVQSLALQATCQACWARHWTPDFPWCSIICTFVLMFNAPDEHFFKEKHRHPEKGSSSPTAGSSVRAWERICGTSHGE